jgi:hypothetical protein
MGNKEYVFGQNSQLAKELKIAACFGNSEINKSEIGYAFSNSNPDMNSLKFNKKGSDLKKMIADKKTSLEEKYNTLTAQVTAAKVKVIEAGIEMKKDTFDDCDRPVYDYNSITDEQRKLVYTYTDLLYPCNRLNNEIKTCQALIDNLDEKKTYTLSTPQVLSLQKAMEFDIEKGGGEGSRGGKIIGHTESGKAIYAGDKDSKKKTEDDDKIDHSNLIHSDSERIAKESGMSHDEFKKLHPKTKEELSKQNPPKDKEVKKSEDEDLQKAFNTLGIIE